MDRNVVTATILIALIMFAWLWWLAPEPREPVSDRPAPVDTIAVDPVDPDTSLPLVESDDVPAPTDTSLVGAEDGTARHITVVSDLYEATFSTRGATPVSFVLREYAKFDQVTPVQVISENARGALGIVFTTPANHLVDTHDLYFESAFEGDTLFVTDEAAGLTFEARLGSGVIRQTYTFSPEEYELGLQIEHQNANSFQTTDGYELVWTGGVPFSEDDPEQEARYSGAYARSGGEVEEVTLDGAATDEVRLSGAVSWVTVKSKYFAAIMIPDGQTRGAEILGETRADPTGTPVWEDFDARLLMPPPGGEVDTYRLYLGPMEFYRISSFDLGLYGVVDYGYNIFEWMTRPLAEFIFIPTFTFLSNFIPNYGLIIILFSILIKVALYPLTKSSFQNMARMRELQPKLEAVKEKHKDDPQKQQAAMMKVYKETGVNPIGGCLPMLLQWPVIIALWQYLPQSIQLRQQGFLWAPDLSAPDVILSLPFTVPFYGDFVAGFTLLMGLSMIVQMRIQSTPSANAQAKVMMYVLPIIMFMFFNRLASGLSLYYLCYNVLSAFQQKLINRKVEHEHEDEASVNGRGGKKEVKKARRVSSQTKKSGSSSSKVPRTVRGRK